MNFHHTEDRRMLSDLLTRFIAQQDGIDVRNEHAHSPAGYSAALWARYAELGAVGALFGEEDGGFGGMGWDIAVVFEALGRGLVVEPFLASLLAGSAIAHAGTAGQRSALGEVMAGKLNVSLAHAEADTHYELPWVLTRATPAGAGWILDGTKTMVEHCEHAGLLVVSARSAGADHDEDGISLFLVPVDTPGLQVRGYPLVDGGRAADVALRGVHLGPQALLGQPGAGHATLEYAAGRGLLALCAEAVGAMDIVRDTTLEYLQTRRQFGVPLGRFQALQHRMADLLLEIEQARSAMINAAAAADHSDRRSRERALSAAKYTVGRVGILVAEEAIQLHGGIGMTWELPLAHYAKRLVMIDHQLGDSDHHLQRYIQLGRT